MPTLSEDGETGKGAIWCSQLTVVVKDKLSRPKQVCPLSLPSLPTINYSNKLRLSPGRRWQITLRTTTTMTMLKTTKGKEAPSHDKASQVWRQLGNVLRSGALYGLATLIWVKDTLVQPLMVRPYTGTTLRPVPVGWRTTVSPIRWPCLMQTRVSLPSRNGSS